MKTSMIDVEGEEFSTKDESIIEFMNRVEMARGKKLILEAQPQIIKHYNPNGLSEAHPYFTYKGVVVCPEGKTEDVIEIMNQTLEEKLHGRSDTKVKTDDY